MCGIIGAVAQRDLAEVLIAGLNKLEYRGYDSAGIAILDHDNQLSRVRVCGKVNDLKDRLNTLKNSQEFTGRIGIAHTRWATHGKPSEDNAHPHVFKDEIALVHNGIIENQSAIKAELIKQGIKFSSQTDTEVIVKLLGVKLSKSKDLLKAFQETISELKGAYALAVISKDHPDRIIAARHHSPLVIGLGFQENFVASDTLALMPFTQKFIMLEEQDVAEIMQDQVKIYNAKGELQKREIKTLDLTLHSAERGDFRHYMQKEIFEQPEAVCAAIEGRLVDEEVLDNIFGQNAGEIFDKVQHCHIVACGTSFFAAEVAKFWLESIARIPTEVEIASEMRYRERIIKPNTLLICISQSGETADTIAALKSATEENFCGKLSICNVPNSTLVRLTDLSLLTHAGPEVGVATTKAFTTQLVGLLLLVYCLAKRTSIDLLLRSKIVDSLRKLPKILEGILSLDNEILEVAKLFKDKNHALFLGRGIHFPIAKEGALKLKEISYIHAEAYPAGELKHGPLALIDENMPVVALAPSDNLLDKLISNLHEVHARGGQLIVLGHNTLNLNIANNLIKLNLPDAPALLSPLVYTIPLQLLAYHVAVLKGTDVDQPRNLAKSVTVE